MTDLGEDTTSNLTSKVVDSVHFAGQRVDTVEGRGLFVEDKDWKLIKAKLDMSSKRGVNGERLWGGIGLAAGAAGPFAELFTKNDFQVFPGLVYVFLFAMGLVLIFVSLYDYWRMKDKRKEEKKMFDEFLDGIEERCNMKQ